MVLSIAGFACPAMGWQSTLSLFRRCLKPQQTLAGHWRAALQQISLSQTNGYVQDFDSLTGSDKSKFVLPGWAIRQFGGGGSQILPDDGTAPDNGKNRAGGIYSYGPVGSQDRALGTLTDANGNFGIFGANSQNTGPDLITRLNISYTGGGWELKVAAPKLSSFAFVTGGFALQVPVIVR